MTAPPTFWRLLAPPPVTPLFQLGGALHGYNEDLFLTAAAFACAALVDALALAFMRRLRPVALRLTAALAVSVAAAPDAWASITAPRGGGMSAAGGAVGPSWCLGPTRGVYAPAIVTGATLYSALALRPSRDERMQYILALSALVLLCVPGKWCGGTALGAGFFWACGPFTAARAAVDVLAHYEYITERTAARAAEGLTWGLRLPALVLHSYATWSGLDDTRLHALLALTGRSYMHLGRQRVQARMRRIAKAHLD